MKNIILFLIAYCLYSSVFGQATIRFGGYKKGDRITVIRPQCLSLNFEIDFEGFGIGNYDVEIILKFAGAPNEKLKVFTTYVNNREFFTVPGTLSICPSDFLLDETSSTLIAEIRRSAIPGSLARTNSYGVLLTDPPITNNKICCDQQFGNNGDPDIIVGSRPSGGIRSFQYQWQRRTDNTRWSNITSANGQDFDSGNLSETTYFRRIVTSGFSTSESNVVKIEILDIPNNLTIGNEFYTTTTSIEACNIITVVGKISTNSSSNVTFNAGNQIKLQQGAILSPNVILKIQDVCNQNNSSSRINTAVINQTPEVLYGVIENTSEGLMEIIEEPPENLFKSMDIERIKIFPNPTQDVLTVVLQAEDISNINMKDMNGKVIYRNSIEVESVDIEVSHLPEGVYTLEIIIDSEVYKRRILVN